MFDHVFHRWVDVGLVVEHEGVEMFLVVLVVGHDLGVPAHQGESVHQLNYGEHPARKRELLEDIGDSRAAGRFEAFAAGTGERLWSVQTGSAINAASASYSIDGVQYVIIPIGAGGGLQFQYPQMHSTEASKGPTRLLAFTLGGEEQLAARPAAYPPLPDQPKLDVPPDVVAMGAAAYKEACKFCHGSNAVARFGGSVPDLRYADATTHAQWDAIVIGGSRRASGMPGMELTADQSAAIRNYVLSLSEVIRRQQ